MKIKYWDESATAGTQCHKHNTSPLHTALPFPTHTQHTAPAPPHLTTAVNGLKQFTFIFAAQSLVYRTSTPIVPASRRAKFTFRPHLYRLVISTNYNGEQMKIYMRL